MFRNVFNRLSNRRKSLDIAKNNGHTLGEFTGNGIYRHDLRGQTLFAIEYTEPDESCIVGKTGVIDLDDAGYATITKPKNMIEHGGNDYVFAKDEKVSEGEGGNNNNDEEEDNEPLYATVVKCNKTEVNDVTSACNGEIGKHTRRKDADTNDNGVSTPVHSEELRENVHDSINEDDIFNFKQGDIDFDIAEMLQEALKYTEENGGDDDSTEGDNAFPSRPGFVRKMVTFNQTSVEIERPVSIAVACPRVPGWAPDDDDTEALAAPAETTADVVLLAEESEPARRLSLSGDRAPVDTDTEDDEVSSISRRAAKKRVTFEEDCISLAMDSDLYSDYGDDGEDCLKVPRWRVRRTAALLLAWLWMVRLVRLIIIVYVKLDNCVDDTFCLLSCLCVLAPLSLSSVDFLKLAFLILHGSLS